MSAPETERKALRKLGDFYARLKARGKYLYFVFSDGVTKSAKGGLRPALGSPADFSPNPENGAARGFAREEIKFCRER